MPRIVETTVFTIDELSDAAKENARIWYRDQGLHDEWYDFVYEDFETICRILGVTLATSPVRLYGGGTRDKPQVYFTGFLESGRRRQLLRPLTATRAVRPEPSAPTPPRDTELHRIADELLAVQRRNFFQLNATIRQQGRYCHEYCMAIEVERDSPTWQPPTDGAEDALIEALRDLARWLYRQLRCEYEHQTSDAAVDEALNVNAFSFHGRGKALRLTRPA